MSTPRVVFQPEVYQGMQDGINQLVDALRPTLGPRPRIVAVERVEGRNESPELLDNGGIIARRILELPHRDADMGAMYLRHLLWRIHEDIGDGTVTAAVLFQAIYNEGVRYVAAGGNAMMLRRHLEDGMHLILTELEQMAVPLTGPEKLAQMAESVCYDTEIARRLGEIFDLIGEYGILDIRSGRSRSVEREYIEGAYWPAALLSKNMVTQAKPKIELKDAAILISDLVLDDIQKIMTVLASAKEAGAEKLLLIASQCSDAVLGLLHQFNQKDRGLKVYAVRTPATGAADQAAAMADLAVLTGGRALIRAAGDTLNSVTPKDFGQARRVWADRDYLGIVRGQGDPRQLRDHYERLQLSFIRSTDRDIRPKLQVRLGRLLGGAAALWVGAATEAEIETRKTLADRAAHTLRGTIRSGMVPGGGVALLACQDVLQNKLDNASTADERAAYRMLHKAMEAPFRAIVSNAGYEASAVLAQLNGPGFGFDVRSGQVVNMTEAGIWDAAAVVRAAVRGTISGAALALTTDVLVHHKTRVQAIEP